jgi:hypothetical protein
MLFIGVEFCFINCFLKENKCVVFQIFKGGISLSVAKIDAMKQTQNHQMIKLKREFQQIIG